MAATSSCSLNLGVKGKGKPEQPFSSSQSSQLLFSSNLSFAYNNTKYCLSLHSHQTLLSACLTKTKNSAFVVASAKPEHLKIMISGAPASGKGTQCELITKKYGLVHIAAGDLLRAEIASGSENGKRAKEYMEKGQLVPNEIVVMMVKDRLLQPDSQENGWLLDGYPRSLSQATALKEFGFRPDLFIVLEVNEEILVERVVGRRLDPVTGKIYHLKYSPPETEEIAARLTQRFDDTEEKACSELICVHLITLEDYVFFVASVSALDQYCQVMIFVFLFIWLYLGEVALANSSSKCRGSTFNV
ncbi:adenylate kinase [Populus alba x Populus x berolinensis]|uniref:adenylate kinase n=2 Tax=Populus alba x Populus x berolinensis TaxID=444605 RepID=A0AAD6LYJ9_9ROSI|nr:adenylate kinase [Populus alba x Populus x berolinensis]